MNIYTVADNLRKTIIGKERMLSGLKNPSDVQDVGARMALIATQEFLSINIDELKKILVDVELCVTQAHEQSWRDNPDRMGGQYTQDEIDNVSRWV